MADYIHSAISDQPSANQDPEFPLNHPAYEPAVISTLIAVLVTLQPGPGDYAKDWGEVRTAIEQRYYARTKQKDRMQSLLDKYASQAKSASSREEFSSTVNRMIDEFGDSHFDFFTPLDQGYYVMDNLVSRSSATNMPHVGIWFAEEGGQHRVQMVMSGSEAEKQGVRKGDWVRLDRGPVGTLEGKKLIELEFIRGSQRRTTALPVEAEPPMSMFLKATKASVRTIEFGGKEYGYLKLWTMASRDFRRALEDAVTGPLAGTHGLILDLRDGFGGSPRGYLDVFFRSDDGQKERYAKPVVALVNEGTRSAKEVASFLLKRSGRATLVGRTTAGHVLGTSPIRMNDWSYLEIPMVEVPIEGEVLEKKGVAPHVELPVEYGPDGKDLILERGLLEIQKLTGEKV